MTDQEPYRSPAEISSEAGKSKSGSLMGCYVAGIVGGGFPFVRGYQIMSEFSAYQAELPDDAMVCGMPALAGMALMVVVAPIFGVGTFLGSLFLQWIWRSIFRK